MGNDNFKALILLVGWIQLLSISLIDEGIRYQAGYLRSYGDSIINENILENKARDYNEYMDSLPFFDTEEQFQEVDVWSKARDFIRSKFPGSPLIDKLQLFGEYNDKAKLALAIAGTESSFGTRGDIATQCFNAWGYLYEGTSKRGCYGSSWQNWESSIPRYMDKASYWLNKFDGQKSSLNQFVGPDRYCASGCTTWIDSTWYFYNQF